MYLVGVTHCSCPCSPAAPGLWLGWSSGEVPVLPWDVGRMLRGKPISAALPCPEHPLGQGRALVCFWVVDPGPLMELEVLLSFWLVAIPVAWLSACLWDTGVQRGLAGRRVPAHRWRLWVLELWQRGG